jgi:dynein heavy chain
LADADIPVFHKIIAGFFPNTKATSPLNEDLVELIKYVMEEMGLYPHERIIQKCLQLYDTMQYKYAILIAGPPVSGKTTTYKILAAALERLNNDITPKKKLSTILLNPKCFSLSDLYGTTKSTMQWVDGVLPNILRQINAEHSRYNVLVKEDGLAESPSLQDLSQLSTSTTDLTKDSLTRSESVYFTIRDAPQTHYWIIFDGPIDARWIETMNSTFDDNKLLCLTNGERIPVPPTVTLLRGTANYKG